MSGKTAPDTMPTGTTSGAPQVLLAHHLNPSGPSAQVIFHVCGWLLEFSNWESAHETDRTSLVQIARGPLEMCTRDAL